jgi:hypothetical protein
MSSNRSLERGRRIRIGARDAQALSPSEPALRFRTGHPHARPCPDDAELHTCRAHAMLPFSSFLSRFTRAGAPRTEAPDAASTSGTGPSPEGPRQGRRSSGQPAPRSALPPRDAWRDVMPHDVLKHIAGKVYQGPPREAARNLAAMSSANSAFRSAADEVASPPLRQMCATLAWGVAHRVEDAADALHYLPALRVLGPQEQARLVDVLLDPQRHGGVLDGPREAVRQLAPHMAELDPPLQARLVDWATGHADEEEAAKAIEALGDGLASLSADRVSQLVAKATGLGEARWRARAIRGVSPGLPRLDVDRQKAVWAAGTGIPDPQYLPVALEGLCPQLQHLPEDRRNQAFDWIMQLPQRGPGVVAGLASSLPRLDPQRRDAVFKEAVRLLDQAGPDPLALELDVLPPLVAHLELLHPDQRNQLVDKVLALTSKHLRATGIAAFGGALEHLDLQPQDALFHAAARLGRRHPNAEVWAGLAKGLRALPADRKDHVVDQVLRIGGSSAAVAVGALAGQLEHLPQAQCIRVAEKAILLLRHNGLDEEEAQALASGLGTGLGALPDPWRRTVVDAVADLRPPQPFVHDDFDHRRWTRVLPAAITGLATGVQALDDNEARVLFKVLHDAASSLADRARNLRGDLRYFGPGDSNLARASRLEAAHIRAIANLAGAAERQRKG